MSCEILFVALSALCFLATAAPQKILFVGAPDNYVARGLDALKIGHDTVSEDGFAKVSPFD